MKNLLKMTMVLVAALSLSHLANAGQIEDMMEENQEGKIVASMIQTKTDAIKQMQKIENEMFKIQDKIADTSNGDSQGRLSAAGQMIDIVSNTIADAKKLDADTDFERIQQALEGVKELRNEAKSLLK